MTGAPTIHRGPPPIARTAAVARGIRRQVLEQTLRNKGGYLAQACSSAEILATLYTQVMRLGPSEGPPIPVPFAGVPGPGNPHAVTGASYNGRRAPEYDRFFLSPVHYAMALYATLIEVERLAPDGLAQFNQDGSTVELIGAEHSPGIEVSAGSFGQALSQAGGVALARKLRGEPGHVWVMLSDGEMEEGQTWEAFAALAFHRLDNVTVYIDANGQQCDGLVETVGRIEPLAARLAAFGAAAHEVDGHDIAALIAPTRAPHPGQPLAIVARTDPRRGLDVLRSRPDARLHYVRFGGEAERRAYEEALARLPDDEEGA